MSQALAGKPEAHRLSTFYRLHILEAVLCIRLFGISHDDIGSCSFGILACDPELLEDVILQVTILQKFDDDKTSDSRVG